MSFSVLNAVPQPTEAEDSAIVPKEVLVCFSVCAPVPLSKSCGLCQGGDDLLKLVEQVEMGLQTYNRALKFQKVGDLEQARKLYISLLDQGILYEVLEETEVFVSSSCYCFSWLKYIHACRIWECKRHRCIHFSLLYIRIMVFSSWTFLPA